MGLYKKAVDKARQDEANAAFLKWYTSRRPRKAGGNAMRFLTQVSPDTFMEESVSLPDKRPRGLSDKMLADMLSREAAMEEADSGKQRKPASKSVYKNVLWNSLVAGAVGGLGGAAAGGLSAGPGGILPGAVLGGAASLLATAVLGTIDPDAGSIVAF